LKPLQDAARFQQTLGNGQKTLQLLEGSAAFQSRNRYGFQPEALRRHNLHFQTPLRAYKQQLSRRMSPPNLPCDGNAWIDVAAGSSASDENAEWFCGFWQAGLHHSSVISHRSFFICRLLSACR
jgi:hypothetical protein